MNHFNADRAATILAEAALSDDCTIARKWGVSTKSIQNWRRRLDTDELFAALFQRKRETLEQDWLSEAPAALRSAIAFINRAATEGDPKNPDQVKAIAGALETLSLVLFTKQIIDVRMNKVS